MWCDPSNYGGIRSKPINNEQTQTPGKSRNKTNKNVSLAHEGVDVEDEECGAENNDVVDEEDDDSPEVEMHWNLASFLPVEGACQKNFTRLQKKSCLSQIFEVFGQKKEFYCLKI